MIGSILAAAILFVGTALWRSQSAHPQNLGPVLFADFSERDVTTLSSLERLGRLKWITAPGFILTKIVDETVIEKSLKEALNPITLRAFLGLKQLAIFFFSILLLLYLWFGEVEAAVVTRLLLLFGLTFVLPNLWLKARKDKISRQLSKEVPYFLDLLVLTLKSGLNIEPALRYTAQSKQGILSSVIGEKLEWLTLGKSLDDIFQELKSQLPNQEFKQFVNSLLRAQKLGVSLASTLDIQAKLIRTKRRQRAEELSRTAAVKISVPLVLFIFPALLIIYIGPGLLQLSQT